MTREEYKQTAWNMTFEEYQACDCSKCDRKETCVHRDAFRRFPEVDGGLGLCPNLRKLQK